MKNRVLLDFMPIVERTIQTYGVIFNNIYYYSNILRPWINATDENNHKLKRKFVFRYDPRDISKLYFLDPELNVYYTIPYRTTSRPAISIWEAREALKKAKTKYAEVNEDLIFSSYEELREIERTAAKTTKAVRRAHQKKVDMQSRTDYLPKVNSQPEVQNLSSANEIDISKNIIKPFDDIDEDIEP